MICQEKPNYRKTRLFSASVQAFRDLFTLMTDIFDKYVRCCIRTDKIAFLVVAFLKINIWNLHIRNSLGMVSDPPPSPISLPPILQSQLHTFCYYSLVQYIVKAGYEKDTHWECLVFSYLHESSLYSNDAKRRLLAFIPLAA